MKIYLTSIEDCDRTKKELNSFFHEITFKVLKRVQLLSYASTNSFPRYILHGTF